MKCCTRCKMEKELSEFYPCKKLKSGRISHCKACDKKLRQAYYAKNKERLLEKKKEYYIENKESIKAYWDTNRERKKEYDAKYRSENTDKRVYYIARRRALKSKTMGYGNAELTDLVMQEAAYVSKARTKATGTQHHVDHIVPLRGDTVCGFHVWNNLRVIPAYENIAKGNKLIEDLL